MGTKPAATSGLANALFSQVQQRVLSLFFGRADRAYQITEVIQLAGSGRGAVQRELEKLTKAGILNVSSIGRRKTYQANRQSPIYAELRGLILKTGGLIEPLQRALSPYRQKIVAAFVFGSVAKGKDTAKSDIDLMILAHDLAYGEVYTALAKVEKRIARPVNPNLMAPGEWKQKVSSRNSFVSKILQQPRIFIFGTDNELKGA